MDKQNAMTRFFFDRLILRHPVAVLACLFATVGFLAYHAKDFKLDASAETLVFETPMTSISGCAATASATRLPMVPYPLIATLIMYDGIQNKN